MRLRVPHEGVAVSNSPESADSEARAAELARELAGRLNGLDSAGLGPAEVRDLLEGMVTMATAVTQLFDGLRGCPALQAREKELDVLAHHTIHSTLEQAAAAAEDLEAGVTELRRLLPSYPQRRP